MGLRLDTQLTVYKGPLFGTLIPSKPDAPFLNNNTSIMLNNYQYNLKVARLIVPIPYKHVLVRLGLYLCWYGVTTNQFIGVWLDTRDG